ncbi:hypothetical protein ANAEL_01057 [Anaerolineales bacterium]|nr:hypothetical protein ANAEL_01057 [Anaerolineales bacterium]
MRKRPYQSFLDEEFKELERNVVCRVGMITFAAVFAVAVLVARPVPWTQDKSHAAFLS